MSKYWVGGYQNNIVKQLGAVMFMYDTVTAKWTEQDIHTNFPAYDSTIVMGIDGIDHEKLWAVGTNNANFGSAWGHPVLMKTIDGGATPWTYVAGTILGIHMFFIDIWVESETKIWILAQDRSGAGRFIYLFDGSNFILQDTTTGVHVSIWGTAENNIYVGGGGLGTRIAYHDDPTWGDITESAWTDHDNATICKGYDEDNVAILGYNHASNNNMRIARGKKGSWTNETLATNFYLINSSYHKNLSIDEDTNIHILGRDIISGDAKIATYDGSWGYTALEGMVANFGAAINCLSSTDGLAVFPSDTDTGKSRSWLNVNGTWIPENTIPSNPVLAEFHVKDIYANEGPILYPVITPLDPIDGEVKVEPEGPFKFNITDPDNQVASFTIDVDGLEIFNGTVFTDAWIASSYTANDENGFAVSLIPTTVLEYGSSHEIECTAIDIATLSTTETWDFEVKRYFSFDIWKFLIQSVRDLDKKEGDLLIWRWLQGPQAEWEDTYYRIKSLAELNDPKLAPADALQYLKWIVGLTSKLDYLTGGLSDDDLRILIAIAVKMWKCKGTPKGFIDTIEAMSTQQVRFLDWFFYRSILGEMELGHDESSVDIWLLDQPGMQTSIYADSLTVTKALDMKLLPSVAAPAWTFNAVNVGVEGSLYTITSETLIHSQNSSNNLGGYYKVEDLGITATDIQMGARWTPTTMTTIGNRPWFISLSDGTREYKLTWSNVELALEDAAGNTIAPIKSFRFIVGESYKMRIAISGTNISASVNGNDLFGNIDSTLFSALAFSGYSFGFDNNEIQNWTVSWDDVGPTPKLDFELSTLLGLTQAVPHAVRVHYKLENVVRTVYSYWDGSKNRCNVTDAFGLNVPILTNSLNDFKVGVDPDEFVSDLKVVDDGDLDRDMIENLVRVMRPAGERIYIRYLAFQDKFRRSGDWVQVAGSVTTDFDNGQLTVDAASVIRTDMNLDTTWKNITARAQAKMTNVPGDYWEMRFNYVDENNFYAVGMNPDDAERSVFLDRVIAGVRTNIGDYNFVNNFFADVYYNLMVQTAWDGSTTLMKVFLDGNYLFEYSNALIEDGRVAIATDGTQETTLSLVEVSMCPHEHARIGPPPDGPPLNNNVCV